MKFFADIHIHSRFSRATSKGLTVRSLAEGAGKKSISVLGTGDFTHPAWLEEIERELTPAGPGLLGLKDGSFPARFMLTAEISTIYKQDGKVRKVHHLIAAPDIASARRIATSLAKVGNILSDGRPILGITSRNLLEIVLAASEHAFLVPAHIWTPWFSALGSKSGFDSIAECYGDLSPHIFAVETGLSSDPPMNWMVKSLDSYRLISNSDAHSAEKLGREATVFDCGLDYFAMLHALKSGEGLCGTVEFFPEEGKYHLDGHRDCGVVLNPDETKELRGMCPVCGRPVTVGVLSRVEELADRHDGSKPESARPFHSLIPLSEILGEIMQTGSASRRVADAYEHLVSRLKGELHLLLDADIDEIRAVAGDVLALAIDRMRQGKVHREAGFDGKFGKVRVFRDNEEDLLFAGRLFGKPLARSAKKAGTRPGRAAEGCGRQTRLRLSPAQENAVSCREGCLLVKAGPGTGKTRTLVERIRALKGAGSEGVLAVTFTTRAAREIRERLKRDDVDVLTFHALAARIMRDCGMRFRIADDDMLLDIASSWGMGRGDLDAVLLALSLNRPLEKNFGFLLDALKAEGYYPYEGMVREAVRLIAQGRFTPVWDHVLVDEFQDINPLQYELLKGLCAGVKSLMVIGDPNQAIYGFRGSSRAGFDDFRASYPNARSVDLIQTYRLSSSIAEASNAFIGAEAVRAYRKGQPIRLVTTPRAPEFIAQEIESLAGGLSHRGTDRAKADYALSDIAVIVRTRQQARSVMEGLSRASIPFDTACAAPLSSVNGIAQRVALLEGKGWQPLVRGVGQRSLESMSADGCAGPEIMELVERAGRLLAGLAGTAAERVDAIEGSGLFKLPPLESGHAFYRYAHLFGDDIEGFVRYMRLSSDQAMLTGERVSVITAHAAKGLEFKCVFVAGLSHGMFPLTGQDEAEERNLFYVAMTRASELLYLVCPDTGPSPFVTMVPPGLVSVVVDRKKAKSSSQLLLFDL